MTAEWRFRISDAPAVADNISRFEVIHRAVERFEFARMHVSAEAVGQSVRQGYCLIVGIKRRQCRDRAKWLGV